VKANNQMHWPPSALDDLYVGATLLSTYWRIKMGNDTIDDVKGKLTELNEFVKPFCPEIRPLAFNILAPLYFDGLAQNRKPIIPSGVDQVDETQICTSDDMGTFFCSFDHKQPKNNVLLITAWLYSQYGVFSINGKTIKDIGNDTGLVIPSRPDNTMRTAKKKGKSLFNQQGKGWKLTVSGESYLRETYGVKKGNKPLEE
jgi:hypothetical protein